MSIRGNVAKYIRDNGIKQVKIAEKTGIDEMKISQIVNEKRRLEADEFVLICKALDKKPEFFIDED